MGFSGYINPFTNEANINRKIPSTSLTFVINHEIAHQLGIASEKDANFISYVMLINSDNHYHKFCGYSYALRLCLNELSKIDYNLYQELLKKVNKDSGEISDGQNTIIDYFTKEQLEILDNINKVESIGGIN